MVRIWRKLPPLSFALPRAVLLDNAGESELADPLYEIWDARWHFGGALLGDARRARRAEKQKDVKTARALAAKIVGAWGNADVELPVVREMRAMLERLR
jgi:hypothetical protein